MKQLKKILIVIAMLALLVASFAIVIGAEEEKEVGTVAKLEKYIASIEAELDNAPTDTAKHQDAGTAAYGYIHDSEIDWTEASGTPEYAAAVAKLDGYCIQVANALCAKIPSPSADVDASMISIEGVYSFFTLPRLGNGHIRKKFVTPDSYSLNFFCIHLFYSPLPTKSTFHKKSNYLLAVLELFFYQRPAFYKIQLKRTFLLQFISTKGDFFPIRPRKYKKTRSICPESQIHIFYIFTRITLGL